jgi:hypothetical protein
MSKKVSTRNAGERIDLVFSGEEEEENTICPDLVWGGVSKAAKNVGDAAHEKAKPKG